MPVPASRTQLANFWADNYAPHGACCICGNKGFIDTRGKVHTGLGKDVGALVWCICPNGAVARRTSKQKGPTPKD